MPSCPKCNKQFKTLPDESNMHGCPYCKCTPESLHECKCKKEDKDEE